MRAACSSAEETYEGGVADISILLFPLIIPVLDFYNSEHLSDLSLQILALNILLLNHFRSVATSIVIC